MGQKILFLGCGKMGSILAEELVEDHDLTVLKKSDKITPVFPFSYVTKLSKLPKNYHADIVFFAIKPQESEEILTEFYAEGLKQKIFSAKTIFISILAGKKIEFFERILGKKAKIIRSMPNLPIQYSQGIFPYLLNKNLTASEAKNLQKIFEKFGHAFSIKNEKEFDALTAIFGSGPAYIFLLQEIFTEIAINSGIAKKESFELVKKLFLGSALMSNFSDHNFLQLRESVTSKGGTTEAAVKILQKNSALKKLFANAISAAIKKSQAL